MTAASPADDTDEVALMQAVAGGDRLAFARLMDLHGRFALALALRLTCNPADAEEVVQEAFLRVWKLAPSWRLGAGARVRTWLYRVVLNLCLDRRRRQPFLALDDVAEPPADDPDGLESLTGVQAAGLVRHVLADLPERQRVALALSYFDDLPASQAAAVMDVSVTAFEALLVRGRRGLRVALARRGLLRLADVL
ncbi:MAG: sigma-70 family RNA polymerase sigma factor [Bacteroidota bacterium]